MEPQGTPSTLVVVHLSGSRRGSTERFRGGPIRIGTEPEADLHFPADLEPEIAPLHAEIRPAGSGFVLEAEPGRQVWLNGRPIEDELLRPGDLIRIGEGGPLLRVRFAADGEREHKSVAEAVRDCADCARHGTSTLAGRALALAFGLPRELATETSRRFRWSALVVILLLGTLIVASLARTASLERKLERAELRLADVQQMLSGSESAAMDRERLLELQQRLESELVETTARLELLERRSRASRTTVAASASTILFLQGAYGLEEAASGLLLRFAAVDERGRPQLSESGEPLLTTEGEGPVLESLFTGTGFLVSGSGLILTNRHVAVPWHDNPSLGQLEARGYRPVLTRFVGFLAGVEKSFPVEVLEADSSADLAVLRCRLEAENPPFLTLRETPAEPGEEVLVLGYPAGIQALLARAGEAFVEELTADGSEIDFWEVAERLSARELLKPLATRGIVGQVTESTVVYDAETTSGGSGGPVIDLDGRVVAVNMAIVPGFGGSNLGVPAGEARRLLASVEAKLALDETAPDPESESSAISNPSPSKAAAPETRSARPEAP